jgi:hypothetical protein
MAAGDGGALGGFWPETFLLLCAEDGDLNSQVIHGMKASYDYTYFRSGRFIVAECLGMVSR